MNSHAARLFAAVVGIALLPCGVFALEQTNNDQPLPAAVADAIKARFPGAELKSATKENENGRVVYDIELKHQSRKYEADIQEDGAILEIEKEIALNDLRPEIKSAIGAKYPKAVIQEIMEVNKVSAKQEKPDHYEVVVQMPDKKSFEVIASLNGNSITEEASEPAAIKLPSTSPPADAHGK